MGIRDKIKEAWNEYWPEGLDRPKVKWDCVHTDTQPTFDPMLGFPNGRKVRESVITRDSMYDAQLPEERRDYCAHKYVELFGCIRDNNMFDKLIRGKCAPIKHAWELCEHEDYVLRMKEYERERRLRERQKRRIALGLEPDPNAQPETM